MTRWQPPERHESIRPERVRRLMQFGFRERQATFLGYVLAFSGVFVERQYRTFTGLVHGQKTHDFLASLVDRRFASVLTPGPLHRGRIFHLHYKPLYEAIEDPDNRHRKPASLPRYVERLMILDAVLADRRVHWMGTERDKVGYFRRFLEGECSEPPLPQIAFGAGREQTVRYFPDKMPIGVPRGDHRHHVFLFVVTRRDPTRFRDFLLRHIGLLHVVYHWVLRIVVPRRFRTAAALYRRAIREAMRPLEPRERDEVAWYCAAQDGRASSAAAPYGLDLKSAGIKYRGSHFDALYRAWQREGDFAFSNARVSAVRDQVQRGVSRVEFAELPYQYLQLTPLLESTGVHDDRESGSDDLRTE